MPLLAACLMMFLNAGAVTIQLDGSAPSQPGKNPVVSGSAGVGYVDIEKVFNEHPLCKRSHEAFDSEAVKRKAELKLLENEITDLQRVIVSSSTQLDVLRSNLALLNKGIMPGSVQSSTSTPIVQAAPVPGPVRILPGMLQAGTTQASDVIRSTGPVAAQTIAPQGISSTTASGIGTSSSGYVSSSENPAPGADLRTMTATVIESIKQTEADIETMKSDVLKKKANIAEKFKQNKQELCDLEARQTDEVLQDIYHIIEKIAKELNLTVVLDRKDVLYGQSYQDLTEKVLERLQGR